MGTHESRPSDGTLHDGEPSEETERKLVHLLGLIIPLALVLLPQTVMVKALTVLAVLSAGIDLVRLQSGTISRIFEKLFGSLLREQERSKITGATYLFISSAICTYFFDKKIAVLALLFLILGDTAAALAGRRFGHTKLFSKTAEGTVACLIVCLLIGLVVPAVSLKVVLAGALVATLIELLPFGVDDNLTVPIASAWLMQMLS